MESLFFQKPQGNYWAAKYERPRMNMMGHLLLFLLQIFTNNQEELKTRNGFVILILEH